MRKAILPDTIPVRDTVPLTDADSIPRVPHIDSFSVRLSKDTLDGPVTYEAEDSAVVLIRQKKIYLYGKTVTKYQDITLTAPEVSIDQETQILTAVARWDSTGRPIQRAHFEQGENNFDSDTIRFNFKTQKGLTKTTYTQQGEFLVIGETVKKVDASTIFIKRGVFTTCLLDDPHFGFRFNKMKVISNKVAVSGPAHPEFEGVPIPIYLPFGFYPLTRGRHSGFLPPTFTSNEDFGLGLEGLGYYKAFNDYWDVEVRANIYSYGGWSVNVTPTYRKRYKYNGRLNFGMITNKFNFKGDPDYIKNKSYSLTWSHSADSRARPGTSFSASVNASSTKYNEYVANNAQRNFQNQQSSSIQYSKSWAGKPYNLTLTANHSQNNRLRLVNVSLPDAGFTVNTLYPFQRKEFAGTAKWYEKLGISYRGSFRNQFSFYDTAFSFRRLIDTLQWGAQHALPITLSLPPILGGNVVVSPSISYSEVWIAQKFRRQWNAAEKKVDTVITKGFFTDRQVTLGLGFNTAVYGTFNFKKSSKIQAIRHVVRPSLSMSYKPDLSRQHFYNTQIDTTGYIRRFSEFEGSLYAGYGEGRFGGLSFQLDNNLEMKVRSKKDTSNGGIKKVRLIDGFGFTTSYNFFADSLNLSPFQLYMRSTLFEKISLTANAVLDPYQKDSRGVSINKFVWQGGKFSLGKIRTASLSMSTSFQSKPRDAEKEKQRQASLDQEFSDPTLQADKQRLMDYMQQNPGEFVDFNIPWSLNFGLSLNFSQVLKRDLSGYETLITSSSNFGGSFSLTPKWQFSVNGNYDFETLKVQYFTMQISRDMHCWQLSIGVTPVGLYRSFNINLSPKSSILQDLKINRNRTFYSY